MGPFLWGNQPIVTDSTLTVKTSSQPAEAADSPLHTVQRVAKRPLPEEDRFTCLPGCGLCCSYRVLVTEADRQRLQAACGVWQKPGFLEKPGFLSSACLAAAGPEPWEATVSGELALRRTPDFCLFLDRQRRCTVYEHRPEHCRAYPYLWATYAWPELDIDFSCPGLGHGESIPAEWRQPPAENAARKSRRESAIQKVQNLLRIQRRYAAPGVLTRLGERCLDELAAGWSATQLAGAASLNVSQTRPLFVNGEMEDALPGLWEGLSLVPQSVEELLADAAFMERHFGQPRWSTRLGPGEKVVLCCFWMTEDAFHVEEVDGTRGEIPLSDIGELVWQPEALATRRAYLERWLKRQLLMRLANNLGVASPLPGSHVVTGYLQFLIEIDWRLAVLAPALARAGGAGTITRSTALEAIRGSDGLLRAWCQSAQIGAIN